jgi:hypothetical protein
MGLNCNYLQINRLRGWSMVAFPDELSIPHPANPNPKRQCAASQPIVHGG